MLFTQINVDNGECKAVGVARSNEEAYAVFNLGIEPETVRDLSEKIVTMKGRDLYVSDGTIPEVMEQLPAEEDLDYLFVDTTVSEEDASTYKERIIKSSASKFLNSSEILEPEPVAVDEVIHEDKEDDNSLPSEIELRKFLSENGAKSVHLIKKYDTLLEKAVELGFTY